MLSKRIFPFWIIITIHSTNTTLSHSPHASHLSSYYQSDTGKSSIQLIDITRYFDVTRYDFIFTSITWLQNVAWHHRLTVYVPDEIQHKEGLMLVNGGINQPTLIKEKDPYDNKYLFFFYTHLARQTHSVIVELKDVPNQYLCLNDGIDRKEDDLLAHSWQQLMKNPCHRYYYPLHFPMAKATSIAIDAISKAGDILNFQAPTNYVLTGVSKRGWSSWLTALEDKRVIALVTAVNEILDVENTLLHIKKSIQHWPEAFNDYLKAGIPAYLGTPAFKKLMAVTDPYHYIHNPTYQQRFALPKYLIRTSGDDFFVPDCQNQLYKTMPGKNYIRVLPNQGHRLNGRQYMLALKDFYSAFINQKTIPDISEFFQEGQLSHIAFDQPAKKVTLWRAYNPSKRDFRFSQGIKYTPLNLSHNQPTPSQKLMRIPTISTTDGFTAQFVEIKFSHITLTTNVHIWPNSFPDDQGFIENTAE